MTELGTDVRQATGVPAPDQAPADPGAAGGRWARFGPLVVTALAGALVALASAYLLWPHGTVNLDEVVYINQADAIAHGRLTFDRADYVPDFRPYLSGLSGDRVVFKYQPLWPGLLAVSDVATGGYRPGLVVAGAGAALAFGFLGRELTGRRRLGAVTGVGVALSPVFVTNSGTALAYLPAGALAAAAVAAAFRGVRTGARGWYAASGVGYGLLFFHRPFDALVTGLPVGVWLLARAWRRRSPGPLVVTTLAAMPFVALWLGYNRLVTGSALTPAFSLDAPQDRFGFGVRSSWLPRDPRLTHQLLDFTPAGSAKTVAHFALFSPLFVLGGVLVLGLAAYAVVAGWRDPRRRVLAGVVVTVIGGHALWWGTQNFVTFGLDEVLGPAYWLGAVGAVAALATAGGADAARRLRAAAPEQRRRALVAAAVVAVASTAATAAIVVPDLSTARRNRAAQVDVLTATPAGSLLVLPGALDDPFVHAVVPADLGGAERLTAVDLASAAQIFRLRDRHPDRPLWRWVPTRASGDLGVPPHLYRLGQLPSLRARRPQLTLDPVAGDARVTAPYLRTVDERGEEVRRAALDARRRPGAGVTARVGAGGGTDLTLGPGATWLALGGTVQRPGEAPQTVELRWPVRARGGQVEIGDAGTPWRLYSLPDKSVWSDEDVSDVVTAGIEGLAPFRPVAQQAKMP
ncbi:MAG TPA: hypothetical protein VKB57_01540 [Acidimicrobiales bacterium]|nr:hypothetical protein [Acidimicrobiales bacterium]